MDHKKLYKKKFDVKTNSIREIPKLDSLSTWIITPCFTSLWVRAVAPSKGYSQQGNSDEEKVSLTEEKLLEAVSRHLDAKGIGRDHEVYRIVKIDMNICAMGLVDYLNKKDKNK